MQKLKNNEARPKFTGSYKKKACKRPASNKYPPQICVKPQSPKTSNKYGNHAGINVNMRNREKQINTAPSGNETCTPSWHNDNGHIYLADEILARQLCMPQPGTKYEKHKGGELTFEICSHQHPSSNI